MIATEGQLKRSNSERVERSQNGSGRRIIVIKPKYKMPPTYHLGTPGAGSFLCPPNHPRHFVRSVFTRFGNSPRRGPSYFLDDTGFDILEEVDTLYGSEKYPQLPLAHERSRLWLAYLRSYFGDEADRLLRCAGRYYDQLRSPIELVNELTEDLPLHWGRGGVSHWWETMEERPSPENCPGESFARHPVNVTWCQVCGWIEEKENAEPTEERPQ